MHSPISCSNAKPNKAAIPILRRLLKLFLPYWKLGSFALLTIFSMDILNVASPKILELLIDQAIPHKDLVLLAVLSFLLLAVPSLTGMVGIAKDFLDVTLSQHIMDDLRRGLYTNLSKQLVKVQIRQTMLGRWFVLILHIFFSAIPALIYYLGGRQVIGGTAQLGQLVAFVALQAILFPTFRSLLDIHISLQGALALFERLFMYLDLPIEICECTNALEMPEVRGHVCFRHVSFHYHLDRPVLHNIDVEIQPGQIVALVGPSGAGKTTMTYLLPRLYDVGEGSLEIDGQDVRSLTFASLARHIGIVTQETYLLHATVRENILYGRPEATEEEMIAVAQAAYIHKRILELPQAYDTVVGPRGYLLSGGEKQRIAIARVLLKNPPILILDEATSALDTHAERLIQSALMRLHQGRTTLAIAHRLSTVLTADQILVLDKGQIIERGTHTDLVCLGGLYAHLYLEQFGKQTPQ